MCGRPHGCNLTQMNFNKKSDVEVIILMAGQWMLESPPFNQKIVNCMDFSLEDVSSIIV